MLRIAFACFTGRPPATRFSKLLPNGLAALTILSAHHPVPDGLVSADLRMNFLAVETGLAYLRETSFGPF